MAKKKRDLIDKVIDESKSVSALNEKLAREIFSNRKVISKLSSDISLLKKMMKDKPEKDKRDEIKKLKETNDKLLEQIKKVTEKTTRPRPVKTSMIEKSLKQLPSNISHDYMKKIHDLNEKIIRYEEKIGRLERQNVQARSYEDPDVRKRLDEQENAISELKYENSRLKDELDFKQKTIDNIQKSRKSDEISPEQVEEIEKLKQQNDKLSFQLAKLKDESSSAIQKLDKAKEQLDLKENEIITLNEKVKKQKSDREKLKEELIKINKYHIDDLKLRDTFEKIKSQLGKELDEKDKQIRMLSSDLKELNLLFKAEAKANRELKQKIKTFDDKDAKISKLNEEIDDKEKVIKRFREEIDILHQGLRENEKNSKELFYEIDNLKASLEEAKKLIQKKDELLDKKEQKVSLLDAQLKSKGKLLDLKTHQYNELENNYTDFKQELEKNAESKLKSYEALIIKREQDIETLNKKIEELTREHDKNLKGLKDEHQEKINTHEKNIESHKNEIDEQKQEISALKESLRVKNDLINNMSKNVDAKSKLLSQMEKNYEKIQKAIKAKDSLLDSNRKKLLEHAKKVQVLNASIITMKEDQKAVENINRELVGKVRKHDEEVSELKEVIKKKDEQLEQKDAYYPLLFEYDRIEMEEKMENMLKENAKKEINHKIELDKLNKIISDQKKMIGDIKIKYMWFANQFRKEFDSVLSDVKEKALADQMLIDEAREYETSNVKEYQAVQDTKRKGALPVSIEEILPMVDVAMQHGDSIEQIKESLLAANYDEKSIEKAIRIVKKG